MADGEAAASVRERLLKEREALLDLSTRNRLLNVPMRTRHVRTIEIVDEKTAEVYRLLGEGKRFAFQPGRQLEDSERTGLPADDRETAAVPQPETTEAMDERGVAQRHADLRLQTRLTSEGLQKRLFDIWTDARTLEEEQGVNILYLALGLLRWFDGAAADDPARHAPLVLLPVQLERSSAADKFRLRGRGEPASPNLSLQAKLKADFALAIEDFADEDAVDIDAYIAKVAETVSKQARWEVLPDAMVLGFFSFSKFLMYRDLDPGTWPPEAPIDHHPAITALLRDGFPEQPGIVPDNDDRSPIDALIPPAERAHVVDADSSQAVVIRETAGGRTLVVKGPPGTGKSQTITNVIAAAAAAGKKVLFVAEKMAALDVVHRRLKQAGLGALALELHSNKANKKAILEELRRTRELQPGPQGGNEDVAARLGEASDRLNAHAAAINTPHAPYGLSAYQVLGHLVRVTAAGAPAGLALDGPESWTPAQAADRTAILRELAERAPGLGDLAAHPWRGVEREPLDPLEREDLFRRIARLASLLAASQGALAVVSDQLGEACVSVGDLARAQRLLAAATTLPAGDRASLAAEAWARDPQALAAVAAAGRELAESRTAAEAAFTESAWSADLAPIRETIATKGTSLLRFLSGRYKASRAALASYLRGPMPKAAAECLALIDVMVRAQKARAGFAAAAPAGAAFGADWRAEASDWAALQARVDWRLAHPDLDAAALARLATADLDALRRARDELERTAEPIRQELAALAQFLALDVPQAFGVPDAEAIPLDALAERLALWSGMRELATVWIAFCARGRAAAALGLGALVDGLKRGALAPVQLVPAFDRAYFEALRGDIFTRVPDLRRFDGETQSRLVAQFCELDTRHMALAQAQIARRHAAERPRAVAGVGPLGRLNEEFAKKRNLLPIRRLLEIAGPAVQQLKPVLMMSPLSVAQFLKPGMLQFDLLVVDEASQIEPVDALGAIARARQLVIVGDERELPPTRFFARLTSDEAEREEDDPTFQTRDAESILELCLAKGMPHRLLNWHYRSKHQSLIAVSNREFYDSRLFIVPAPYDAPAGMGLKFNYLPAATYDRGNTRTNAVEARAVAAAVMAHARAHPEQSLGVATFSTAQRQAILRELELLRRREPPLEEFFAAAGSEPFFVKNLENVQGDERDVIFISVGYGKDASGYMMMNFGPLSGEGGERRLNVLISRAKLRCEVFASIRGSDIDLERGRSRGVAALKLFLTFAETGTFGMGDGSGRGHDSALEEQIAQRLAALGHEVRAQIGAAGFFVDLAVVDPEAPGRFLLGIECDGAQYHASRSARDRDRLRQQVLEAHGWVIHRIWSADWYMRPAEELKKLEAAIARARTIWRERDEAAAQPTKEPAPPSAAEPERAESESAPAPPAAVPAAAAPAPALTEPYREADFAVNRDFEPHLVPLATMTAHVVRIVEIEGPIHEAEIVTRIRVLWGLARAGGRIREAVARAVAAAASRGLIAGGPFYLRPGAAIPIRDRSAVESQALRKAELLPPAEIEALLLKLVEQNYGATREELILAAARGFGFAATSAPLREVIERGIDSLLAAGRLRTKGELLTAAPRDEANATT